MSVHNEAENNQPSQKAHLCSFVTAYPKGDSILICEAWHTSSICELYVKGIVLLVVRFLVSTYFIQHYLWLIYIVVHEFYSIPFCV